MHVERQRRGLATSALYSRVSRPTEMLPETTLSHSSTFSTWLILTRFEQN
jgi:hypothetical protein